MSPLPAANAQDAPSSREISLELHSLGIEFYGYTDGASRNDDSAVTLRRNPSRGENWGVAVIRLRHRFQQIVDAIGFDNVEGISFVASGGGQIRVWVKPVDEPDAEPSTLGGQTYGANGSVIRIGRDILAEARRRGGVKSIVIDLVSGEAELSRFQVHCRRPIPAETNPAGPIPIHPPAEVRGNELRFGREIQSQIEELSVDVPRVNPRADIEWMLRHQDPNTGLIPDSDTSTMGDFLSSWSYIQGTALMRLVEAGELDAARRLASRLATLQIRDGALRGGWHRGWRSHNAEPITREVGAGEAAWIGFGFYHLYLATGESRWLDPLYAAAKFCAEGQALDPSRRTYGMVHRMVDASGNLLPWPSAENALDAAALFYKLGQLELPRADVERLTRNGVYLDRLELLARARLTVDWLVRPSEQGGMWTGERFHVGYGDPEGNSFSSYDEPTDCQTWTLLLLGALRDIHPYNPQDYRSGLQWILSYLKDIRRAEEWVYGFSRKPYSAAPSISAEFTLGYARAARVAGLPRLADFFTAQVEKLREEGLLLSIVGPPDARFPLNEPVIHMTPSNWAAFQGNPFGIPTTLPRADSVRLSPLPELATIEAKIRLLSGQGQRRSQKRRSNSGKKSRAGFIGRGELADEKVVEELIEKWQQLGPGEPLKINSELRVGEWFLPALGKIQQVTSDILGLSQQEVNVVHLTEKEDWVLSKLWSLLENMDKPNYFPDGVDKNATFVFADSKVKIGSIREKELDLQIQLIPFEGSFFDRSNFLSSFACSFLGGESEKNFHYLGFNIHFINFLRFEAPKILKEEDGIQISGETLVAAAIFHELIHALAHYLPEPWQAKERQVHQEARVLEFKVLFPGLLRVKRGRGLAPHVRQLIKKGTSPLNRAISAFLRGQNSYSKLDRQKLLEKLGATGEIGPFLCDPHLVLFDSAL